MLYGERAQCTIPCQEEKGILRDLEVQGLICGLVFPQRDIFSGDDDGELDLQIVRDDYELHILHLDVVELGEMPPLFGIVEGENVNGVDEGAHNEVAVHGPTAY